MDKTQSVSDDFTHTGVRNAMVTYVRELQDRICAALEAADGEAMFREDAWDRPGGGGGRTRVMVDGSLFEKGGVNTSVVHGELPPKMVERLGVTDARFFATGLSLVIHPRSPRIPTVHANYRYFEQANGDAWFGGGADLTPYIADERDGQHFHTTLRDACAPFGEQLYPHFKKQCDEYFFIRHRGECRGIGGVFYDYLRGGADELHRGADALRADGVELHGVESEPRQVDSGLRREDELLRSRDSGIPHDETVRRGDESHLRLWLRFQQSMGDALLPAYLPIVERHRDESHTDREKKFQLLRRGRYVEFNLLYDRGTTFGLETDGRVESILMSLPPVVNYDYDPPMETNESERMLMSWLRHPREWT